MRPSSATSRLIVAWVARKPRSRRAAASSCWVRIGALLEEVPDRPLAELLHHLHGGPALSASRTKAKMSDGEARPGRR